MPEQQIKLKFPRIHRVGLRRFSLYTANPNAEFDCGEGVICLAGANGIGKSTLLSAINFGLTGIVADPSRTFESMEEYYKFTRTFASNYFRGRIVGSDEDDAEISITFQLGEFDYEIKRGLFEADELRGFTRRHRTNNQAPLESEDMPRGERHRVYVEHFVRDSGVASFEEFTFLQLFVFTFDEQRKTLFWNPRIMERVLYRAFGLNSNMAKQADNLRREIQHEDSRVRNYQWEATGMRKRINEIRTLSQVESGAQSKYDALMVDHEELSRQFEVESKALRDAEDALKDANLQLSNYSVKENALRDEYAKYFDHRFNLRPPLEQHPMITQSISQHACGLCGATSDAALLILKANSAKANCPLCESVLQNNSMEPVDSARLIEIDKELGKLKLGIRNTLKLLDGLRLSEEGARSKWVSTKESLDLFDQQNNAILLSLRQTLNRGGGGESALTEYRDQLAALENDKRVAYEKREDLKRQLVNLQKELEQQYLQVEEHFVPQFAVLAKQFLGMDLAVQMNTRSTGDVELVVSVRGTTRRHQQNLSESQRFFLDIALRMALTRHMSDPTCKGGMYIDTPEGSLDIAYEKRAGDMLAIFSEGGHPVVMTANLNSSKLLLALANRCKRKGMLLVRMTDWSELTEVQQEEQGLFDEAFSDIEKALDA